MRNTSAYNKAEVFFMHDESSYGNGLFSIIKGVGIAVACSFLSAVVFASVLRASSLSDSVIYPVNQMLKSVSILLGVLVAVRGEKGLIKGAAVGALYTAVSYLLFASIGGDFSLSWLILAELLLCVVVGGLSGIIAVNLKR